LHCVLGGVGCRVVRDEVGKGGIGGCAVRTAPHENRRETTQRGGGGCITTLLYP
jgi:hypothetical protein